MTPIDKLGMGDLLARVKAATGPDRGLDGLLAIAFPPEGEERTELGDATGRYGKYWFKHEFSEGSALSQPYTASIDAALALVERVAPGGLLDLRLGYEPGSADRAWPAVTIRFYPEGVLVDGRQWSCAIEGAPTPALAILAALLAALSLDTKGDGV